ncbi:hypothetical protein V8E36_004907, partial [Tilletia maclaganii]
MSKESPSDHGRTKTSTRRGNPKLRQRLPEIASTRLKTSSQTTGARLSSITNPIEAVQMFNETRTPAYTQPMRPYEPTTIASCPPNISDQPLGSSRSTGVPPGEGWDRRPESRGPPGTPKPGGGYPGGGGDPGGGGPFGSGGGGPGGPGGGGGGTPGPYDSFGVGPPRGPGGSGGPGDPGGTPTPNDRRPRELDRERAPRMPRQQELGEFDTDQRRPLAFWAHVEHIRAEGIYEDRAILGILGSCMSGEAIDWWDALYPRPTTWEQWREAFFRRWTKDPKTSSRDLLQRRFNAREDMSSSYLYDKYWLVGMESIARLVHHRIFDSVLVPTAVTQIMSQRTVQELIGIVHDGLPATWQGRTIDIAENAISWDDYVHRMLAREPYLRSEFRHFVEKDQDKQDDSDDDESRARSSTWIGGGKGSVRDSRGRYTTRRKSKSARSVKSGQRAGKRASGSKRRQLTEAEKEQRRKDREKGGCFLCHQAGHFARDCRTHRDDQSARYVRRIEKRFPRINRVIAAVLTAIQHGDDSDGASEDGDSSSSDDTDTGTDDLSESSGDESKYDVRRVNQHTRIITRRTQTGSTSKPGSRHHRATALRVQVKVEGADRFELLLDTGSEISLISTRALLSLAPDVQRFPAEDITLQGFDEGEAQTTKSVVVLPITFLAKDEESRTEWCEFHEVDRCADGWFLGVDNMADVGIACDPANGTAFFTTSPSLRLPSIVDTPRDRKHSQQVKVEDTDELEPIDLSGLKQEESSNFEELEIDKPEEDEKVRVAFSDALSPEQEQQMVEAIQGLPVWPTKARPLGYYKDELFDIKLKPGNESWIHAEPPRRTLPAQRAAILETLREQDELGLSEPGVSSFSTGVVLVPQKDKMRMCCDYRPINGRTEAETYYTPTVDEVYALLCFALFLTIIDCNKGYHQNFLTERARLILAFVTHLGLRL